MDIVSFMRPVQNIVAGILIIGFGIIIGNIGSIIIKKILEGFESERLLSSVGVKFPVVEFLCAIVKYSMYLVGLIWGLTFLKLDTILLYTVLFIILGLLIMFIMLSIKDFFPNFLSGIVNYFTKKVKEGDQISMDSAEGKVIDVGALEIKVKMKDGDIVIIPFTLISQKIVVKKKVS